MRRWRRSRRRRRGRRKIEKPLAKGEIEYHL
jgi:hypothetical protein